MLLRHLPAQLPVIQAMLALVMTKKGDAMPSLPGPELAATVPPRSPALVADYLRLIGGDPKAWRGQLPPHLFPQWGFPLLSRALHGLPYDLTKVINAGCHYTVNAPLPIDANLLLRARLDAVDESERRVLLTLTVVTGTVDEPDALEAGITAYVPKPRPKAALSGGPKRVKAEPARVPVGARLVGERRLRANAGGSYALLTGDINPIHWIKPIARASGFKSTILHGFCTAAIAAEAITRTVHSGDVQRLTGLQARFVRPLALPGKARVFIDDDGGVFVGDNPGAPAFLTGAFQHG